MSADNVCSDKIFNVLIRYNNPPEMELRAAIMHESALWLVVGWLEHRAERARRPARLVRPLRLRFERVRDPRPFGPDYSLSGPLPRCMLDGPVLALRELGFDVLDLPDARFPVEILH